MTAQELSILHDCIIGISSAQGLTATDAYGFMVVRGRESNHLIFPFQVRIGFNSGFKFQFSSG